MTTALKILKIIGNIILWILAVVLALLIFILFCPIYYEINGEKYENINAEARVKLFLGIVGFKIKYDGKNVLTEIRLFGRKIKRKEKKEKTEEKKTEPETKLAKEVPKWPAPGKKRTEVPKISIPEEKIIPAEEGWKNDDNYKPDGKVRKISFPQESVENDVRKPAEVKIIKMSEASDKEKSDTAEKIEPEGKRVDLDYFVKMSKEDRKKLIKAVIKLLKSLLNGIKPKDFYLIGAVGTDDPSVTGQIVGAAWALNGILNKRIEISGVYDRKIIEGKFRIKGHIVPAFMMFYIIRFILVKSVWRTIKLIIKGDKNGERNGK